MTVSIVRMTIVFALLNAPFWWLGRTNFFSRAWFNVDLLLPAVLAPIAPVVAGISLIVFWTLDLAVSQSLAWNFHSPFEFVRSVEFVPMLHVGSYLSTQAALQAASFAIFGLIGLRTARRTQQGGRAAAILFVTIALVDILNGSSFVHLAAQRLLPGNVAGSATKMVAASVLAQRTEQLRSLPERTSLTAQFDVLSYARAHPDRGILLVVVESMGLHRDPAMRLLLRERLIDARTAGRFEVKEYSVPFNGSTVAGELRELCGLQGDYRRLASAPQPCLPAQLAAMGWSTLGLHGFSHRLFMRNKWWTHTGLQSIRFAEDLTLPGQTLCGGAFVGICDGDLLRQAIHEAERPKRFVYALTLNSHLPLGRAELGAESSRQCVQAQFGSDVCALVSVIGTALDAIRKGLSEATKPPLVLVVGDHAPPFGVLDARQQFSQIDVPGFVLIPRP